MNKNLEFILNDETINSYGHIIKTSGVIIDRLKNNGVILPDHKRGVLNVIGRWENIRKYGNKIIATAVFDENDEVAVKIRDKILNGFLNAVSIGVNILEFTKPMKDGDPYIITKSEIFEASIVDIPSNKNALRLTYKNKELTMSEDTNTKELTMFLSEGSEGSEAVDLSTVETTVVTEELPNVLEDVATLTVEEVDDTTINEEEVALDTELMINDATPKVITDTLSLSLELKEKKDIILSLSTEINDLKSTVINLTNEKNYNEIISAKNSGYINDKQVDTLVKLSYTDMNSVRELIKNSNRVQKSPVTLSTKVNDAVDNANDTFEYHFKNNTLVKLKANDPAKYARLVADYENKIK